MYLYHERRTPSRGAVGLLLASEDYSHEMRILEQALLQYSRTALHFYGLKSLLYCMS